MTVQRLFVLCLLALPFVWSPNVGAQENRQTFERFRLLLATGERVDGRDGVLTDTAFRGMRGSGEINVSLGDIRSLDISSGSQAGKGLAIGLGVGLVSALAGILSAAADETRTLDTSKILPVAVGLTVGGGALGLLVGSRYPKWERLSLQDHRGPAPRVRITLIGIECRF
ncbi:MAG: hypothetical protein LJF04_15170 [Gemmatimonadetes bacterium]|nr:hypothetical protein [Gemmatimonadota bacterium]